MVVRISLLFHLWGATAPHLPSLRMETWAIRNGSPHWCHDKAGHPCWLGKDLCSPCSQRTGCHRGLPLQDLCRQGCKAQSQWPFLLSHAVLFHWSLLTHPYSLTLRVSSYLEPTSYFSMAVPWSWRRGLHTYFLLLIH